MGKKALSTGYRTGEQQEVLVNLDEQLGNYYHFLHNEGKDKDKSSSLLSSPHSSEKITKKEVKVKKTSGNTREYRDGLRSGMVAVAKKGDKRKAVGLAIALGVAQDIL